MVTQTNPYANIILRKLLVTLTEKSEFGLGLGRVGGGDLNRIMEFWKPKKFLKNFFEITKKFFQLRSGYLFL